MIAVLLAPFGAHASSNNADWTAAPVQAASAPALGAADNADYQKLGKISFHALIFHIYDAELWGTKEQFTWDSPFKLKLTYARKISQDKLVEPSLEEMARIADKDPSAFEHFREPLNDCFVDVRKGDEITGQSVDRHTARFYFNDVQTCELTIPNGSEQFFGIWLGDNTQAPKKSKRLRGLDV